MDEVLNTDYRGHKKIMGDVREKCRLQKMEERTEECLFTKDHWQSVFSGKYKTSWRGLPLMKSPFEIITYQQMIWDIKPRSILEIGSNCGGSAIWMADISKMFGGNCHVYSMDIDLGLLEPLAKEKREDITFVEGDANQIESNASYAKLVDSCLCKHAGLPHPWIVSEDAHVNVEGVLEYLHQFMEPGDYILIEDTSPFTPLTRDDGTFEFVNLEGWGRWKLQLAIDFMKKYPNHYRIDTKYNDFFGYNISTNMNGYLKRI